MLWPMLWIATKPGIIVCTKMTAEAGSLGSFTIFGGGVVGGVVSTEVAKKIYNYFFVVPNLANSLHVLQEKQMQVIKENLIEKNQKTELIHEETFKKIEKVSDTVDDIEALVLKIRENTQPLLLFLDELEKKNEKLQQLPSYYLLVINHFIQKIRDGGLEELIEELKQSRCREEHLIGKLSFFVSRYEQKQLEQTSNPNLPILG